jgi:hypothetical protein
MHLDPVPLKFLFTHARPGMREDKLMNHGNLLKCREAFSKPFVNPLALAMGI